MRTQKHPTILITGCSSGFGHSTAALFLTRGWNVIATMRNPKREFLPESERLLQTSLDVTQPASIETAIAQGVACFGKIDVVVNNAGIGLFGAHEATTNEVVREVFETNTFGVMEVSRAITPHMRKRGSGTIINVTSSVGIAPMPLVAAYTASKYAIEGFSEALAYELETLGIRVKLVQPGFAPSTRFAANSGTRCDNLIPPAYGPLAGRYLKSVQENPGGHTTSQDVAEKVYEAATDGRNQLRYPAGADSMMLAEWRSTLDEGAFLARIRTMCGWE